MKKLIALTTAAFMLATPAHADSQQEADLVNGSVQAGKLMMLCTLKKTKGIEPWVFRATVRVLLKNMVKEYSRRSMFYMNKLIEIKDPYCLQRIKYVDPEGD